MSITFHGVSSDSLGLIVEHYPSYNIPARKMSAFSVAGRSGDILYQENAYENVIQDYDVYIRKGTALTQSIQKVIAWLMVDGYARLEDSYNANQFRLAYCNNAAEIANALNEFGRCTLSFTCMPYRYLTSGETEVTIVSPHTLTNPTPYPASPLIYVNTASSGSIDIDGVTIDCDVGEYYIDCDTQNAYFGTVNMNSYINAPVFPAISGTSVVTVSTVTTCKITPRWRTL